MKSCEQCGKQAFRDDERYCKTCRASILALIRNAHIPIPQDAYRSPEKMEATRETKYGIDR